MKSLRLFVPIVIFVFLLIGTVPLSADTSGIDAINVRLDNGMRVVMLESHSVPLISIITSINAGSGMEDYRLNGITHLLEHMLFNGTDSRTQEQVYDDVDLIGGMNNAFTREDYTAFYITAPSRNAEKALEIQSDMLFHSNFPTEKTTKELGIIEEEIRGTISDPGYAVSADFNAWLFSGTPYARTTLGTINGIKRITTEDIKNYWATYYSPNNMLMVITGDFQPGEMLDLLNKYFGDELPQDLSHLKRAPVPQITNDNKTIDYVKEGGHSIELAMNAPSPTDADGAAFSFMTEFVGDEINTYLAEKSPGLMASVGPTDYMMGSRLVISAEIPDGVSEDDAEQWIREAVAKCVSLKTDPGMLESAKAASLGTYASLIENLLSSGQYLINDAAIWGWDYMAQGPERINAITIAAIDAARVKYLTDPNIWTFIVRPFPEESSGTTGGEAEYFSETLPNGLKVGIKHDGSSSVFGMHLLVEGRSYVEPFDKHGLVELLQSCLGDVASDTTSGTIGSRLASIGAHVKTSDLSFIPFDDYYFDPEYSYFRFTGVDKFWAENISVLKDLISTDVITSDVVDSANHGLIKASMIFGGQASDKGRDLFREKMRGAENVPPPLRGTAESLGAITFDDVRNFESKYFVPGNMVLTIVTSIDPQEILGKVRETFGTLSAGTNEFNVPHPKYNSYPGEEFRVDVGGPQSYIIYAFPIFEVPEADEIPLEILGSVISKEIAFELRERQGLAYSIGASFTAEKGQGYFSISMGTGPDNIDKAKEGIMKVLHDMQTSTLDQTELEIAMNSMTARLIRYRVKRENQAYYMGYDIYKAEDPMRDVVGPWYDVTVDDLIRVRDKYFNPDNGFFVIAK